MKSASWTTSEIKRGWFEISINWADERFRSRKIPFERQTNLSGFISTLFPLLSRLLQVIRSLIWEIFKWKTAKTRTQAQKLGPQFRSGMAGVICFVQIMCPNWWKVTLVAQFWLFFIVHCLPVELEPFHRPCSHKNAQNENCFDIWIAIEWTKSGSKIHPSVVMFQNYPCL